MNKHEAIKKIKNIGTLNIYDKVAGQQVDMVIKNEVLDIISQIHEPQKVVRPRMILDVIENFDEYIDNLYEYISRQLEDRENAEQLIDSDQYAIESLKKELVEE